MTKTPASAQQTIQHNPFATRFSRPGAIPFLPENHQSLDEMVDSFRTHHFLGQIVGPHGCGKTTLTHSMQKILAEDFQSVRRVTIRDPRNVLTTQAERPHTSEPGIRAARQLLILDGFERLPKLHRWLLINRSTRSGFGLLITTHKRIHRIPVLCELSPTSNTLALVVKHLAPEFPIDLETIETIFEQTGGNIRESLMMLYDWFEVHGP